MKNLVSAKTLLAAAVLVALTGCGSDKKDSPAPSSSSSSKAASSVAVSSVAASSVASSVASSKASSAVASSVASSKASSSAAAAAEFVIFDEKAATGWKIWDCCGGTTPAVVPATDTKYGNVVGFEIVGSTVVGFDSRKQTPATPTLDLTSIVATGTISFDILLTQAPKNADAAWNLKVESYDKATDVGFDLSQEGIAKPVLNKWTRLTFNLSTVKAVGGVKMDAVDVVMIFPSWGSGDGAKFQIDNLKISPTGAKAE